MMKKTILLAMFAIGLVSCRSLEYQEFTFVEDYSNYVGDGFYIYPKEASNITLDYVPVSIVDIEAHAGKPAKGQKLDGLLISENGDPNTFADLAVPTPEYMMKRLVEEAKKKGANAIINYKNVKIGRYRYRASGLAVKLTKP